MQTGSFSKLSGEVEVDETYRPEGTQHAPGRARPQRGLHGTYIRVEPWHLFRYLDERVFTFNQRTMTDLGRLTLVLGLVSERRLTYAALTAAAEA